METCVGATSVSTSGAMIDTSLIYPDLTNMEPEHEPLEEEIPTKKHHFQGSMLVFGGVL